MKLYGLHASPFVQRALIVARAKGHELAVEPPPGGGARAAEFQPISPMRRIPVLACDDGWTLAESGAIAAYLDETLGGPSLMPADPRGRARVRLVEELVGIELAGMRPILMGVVFGYPIAAEVVAAGRVQLGNGLDALERVLAADDRFAVGDALTRADALLTPILTTMTVVGAHAGTDGMIEARPTIDTYRARAHDDPILARTIAEMRAGFAPHLAAAGRS